MNWKRQAPFLSQLSQPQPHDGAAAAAALQRVLVSVLEGHHRTRGATGGADRPAGHPEL